MDTLPPIDPKRPDPFDLAAPRVDHVTAAPLLKEGFHPGLQLLQEARVAGPN
jgi:hypothetical protein